MTDLKWTRIGTALDVYLNYFYGKRPAIGARPFAEQMDELRRDFFAGTSDALGTALAPLGYEIESYVMNAQPAQLKWAAENGLDYRQDEWMLAIAKAQIVRSKPDVLTLDPYSVPPDWLAEVRAECPTLRLVTARYGAPKQDLSRFLLCDVVFSGDLDQVAELTSMGVRSEHLYHGFDRRILDHLAPLDPRYGVLFLGQVLRYPGFHLRRAEVLSGLLEAEVDLRLRLLAEDLTLTGRWKQRARRLAWDLARALPERVLEHVPPLQRVHGLPARPAAPLDRRFRAAALPPLFGLDMYRELRDARVTLNIHGDVTKGDANNLRLWEATGVGSCLLTDHKRNMNELFDTEKEVITFTGVEDCVEKLQWLLSHESERAAVAAAGQRRTLTDHTYEKRALQVHDAIMAALRHQN